MQRNLFVLLLVLLVSFSPACASKIAAPKTASAMAAQTKAAAREKGTDNQSKEYLTFPSSSPDNATVGGQLANIEDAKVYWIKLKAGQPLSIIGGTNITLTLTDPSGKEVETTAKGCRCMIKLSQASAGDYKLKIELCKAAKEHYDGAYNVILMLDGTVEMQGDCND